MWKVLNFRCGVVWAATFCLFVAVTIASAQDSKILGEVKFQGATKVERDSGGRVDGLRYMLISPGKHRLKIGLPGYQTFEAEVNLLAGQKSEVKTELVKGSIKQATSDIKQPR